MGRATKKDEKLSQEVFFETLAFLFISLKDII